MLNGCDTDELLGIRPTLPLHTEFLLYLGLFWLLLSYFVIEILSTLRVKTCALSSPGYSAQNSGMYITDS